MPNSRCVLLVVAACSSKTDAPPAPPPPAPPPAPAPAPDAAAARSWPSDFPAVGGKLATGNLVGKPFKIAKAVMRETASTYDLSLYSWKEGLACEPQFAPDPNQLYISVQFPKTLMKTGGQIQDTDTNTVITYQHELDVSHMPKRTVAIQIDDVTPNHVGGRLQFTSSDGSAVSGRFDATLCAAVAHDLPAPEPLFGHAWGDTNTAPAKLPAQPIEGVYLGKRGKPLSVEIVDWQDNGVGQHEVHIFMTPPKQPCLPDQLGTGFKLGFGKTIAAGASFDQSTTLVTSTGSPWATVEWMDTGNVIQMEGQGHATAIIDGVKGDEVRGRVLAWFKDPSKSIVAGAFVGTRCHIKL